MDWTWTVPTWLIVSNLLFFYCGYQLGQRKAKRAAFEHFLKYGSSQINEIYKDSR